MCDLERFSKIQSQFVLNYSHRNLQFTSRRCHLECALIRLDLIRFNDRSHSAVLTIIVRESCSSFTKFGKAVLCGTTAASTSLMVLSSCCLSATTFG